MKSGFKQHLLRTMAALAITVGGAALGSAMAQQSGGAAQSKADWAKMVRMSPSGGHILGNPLARNRLVEFVSYTCPHCADYAEQSALAMKTRYIPKGTTSVEVRNFVRDPFDLTAALLARCGSKDKFFGNHAAILAAQKSWVGKAQSATQAQRQSWESAPMPQRLSLIAKDTGLAALMRGRGYNDSQITQCVTDQKEIALLIKMTQSAANETKITGTPSFIINGELVEKTHDWQTLEPKLKAL
ncbi:MAG: thioredoxin domain-containing protein [Pseudomonadota bacterium]